MARFLVHIHTGPADPNKVTLGAFIAAEAARQGHAVTLFFAGDAVDSLSPVHRDRMEGLGTGRLAEHLVALGAAGGTVCISRLSAVARDHDEGLLTGLGAPARFATPDMLVALAAEADTVLCY